MRRFAKIDDGGVVKQVIVARSSDWCKEAFGGEWIETFKDGSQRFNYAGPGFTYDKNLDGFIPPKPFESWVLVEETCLWEAPIPYPKDGNEYVWDEEAGNWVEMEA